jgi:hypothetical protein
VTILVLLILAIIWLAVLLPPYLQNRSEKRPADSISSFQRQLSVLERRSTTVNGSGRSGPLPMVRMTRAEARKRRRDVLFTLLGAASITFAMALFKGGPVWGLQILCDLLVVGYVFLLVQTQQREAERETKVRYLPGRTTRAPEPALLLRRSGS